MHDDRRFRPGNGQSPRRSSSASSWPSERGRRDQRSSVGFSAESRRNPTGFGSDSSSSRGSRSGSSFGSSSGFGRGHGGRSTAQATVIDPTYSPASRVKLVLVLFSIVAALIAGRLLWVQLIDPQGVFDKSGFQRVQTVDVAAHRGTIYDRNGIVLATSTDVANIFCRPQSVPHDKVTELADWLAEHCGGEAQEYRDKIVSDASFVYLTKGADLKLGRELLDLGIEGVDYEKAEKRIYPCGAVGSQVIGFMNEDGEPVCGIELQYNDILKGQPGKREISYSRNLVPIPGSEKVIEQARAGNDIVLTIDIGLQGQVEQALKGSVEGLEASGGNAMVMDASNGEIYACASNPTFDVTDTSSITDNAMTNLTSLSLSFEPGSIFKPVAMLAALEAGTTKAGQSYYCPAELTVGEYTITDSHERADATMDTARIMADSSNVGMSLIARDLGNQGLHDAIERYQMTGTLPIDFPGTASGDLTDAGSWSVVQGFNIAFGQGLRTTPANIVRFYGALANDGVAVQPHFLLDVPSEDQPRSYETVDLIDDKAALDEVVDMMELVVEDGTGTAAQIPGYCIAGKTGTAEIASEEGGYRKNVYNNSFVGFLPDASLELVCYVGATEVPSEGQTVPAFKDIMSYAIERYAITQK